MRNILRTSKRDFYTSLYHTGHKKRKEMKPGILINIMQIDMLAFTKWNHVHLMKYFLGRWSSYDPWGMTLFVQFP